MSLKIRIQSEIIDVAGIPVEYYPVGARDKGLLRWPHGKPTYDVCQPGHHYLFKLSDKRYPEQYWVEIFAYQFGCLIDVSVPPAFIAYNSQTQNPAALIEWSYTLEKDEYESGGDIMQRLIPNYDRHKGRQHNLKSIFEYLETLEFVANCDWQKQWAKMLMFDALIGNTDRHQENWGLIIPATPLVRRQYVLAPAMDNGTSMGHEIMIQNLKKYIKSEEIQKYIRKGKPHMALAPISEYKKRDNQEMFIQRVAQAYPYLKEIMEKCLDFSVKDVSEILDRLQDFPILNPLHPRKSRFYAKINLF